MKRTKVLLLAVFALSLLFSGCAATLPSVTEMQKDVEGYTLPQSPAADKAMVYVVRPSGLGSMVKFNVFLDDKEPSSEMGYTKGGQYICFNLEPGKHLILSNAENWAELEVAAKTGEIIYIKQDPAMGILYARNNLSVIYDYEGKYHLRRLAPGTMKQSDKPKKE